MRDVDTKNLRANCLNTTSSKAISAKYSEKNCPFDQEKQSKSPEFI